MSGAASGSRAHACTATGLQALAELINDVLASRVTQPAPAGPLVVLRSTTGARTSGPAEHPGRAGHGSAAGPPGPRASRLLGRGRGTRSPTPADTSPPKPSDDVTVQDEHAEIWRLVRRAQDGDGEAFGQLYDRYVDTVFRFVYLRVNDRALAEDFTSETFVRALRRISSISYQGRDIGAWFITIARNIVYDHTKSARHRLEMTTADTIEGPEQSPSTETAVLQTLDTERLMAAVARLGDDQRECIQLRFLHGLSVSETATVMGKNDGAIKALQHRAVRKLADLLDGTP